MFVFFFSLSMSSRIHSYCNMYQNFLIGWKKYSIGYTDPILFIHSSMNDTSCFLLEIMNNAAMSIGIQIYLWALLFYLLGNILKSGIAGLYRNIVFKALPYCILLHLIGCILLYIPQVFHFSMCSPTPLFSVFSSFWSSHSNEYEVVALTS